MWNSMGGGFDGGGGVGDGGFMNAGSQFQSPGGGQDQKKVRKSQNLVPVTLQTVVKCEEDPLQIHGKEAHMIVVVGLIRAVDVTSTKITYTIDDSTATIEAVQWIESDQEDESSTRNPLMEMTYCHVSGSIRTQQGKRHIMVFRIDPITDLNLITTHLLEVMYTNLKLQNIGTMKEAQDSGVGMSGMGHGASMGMMSNSLMGASDLNSRTGGTSMGGGSFAGMQGLSGQQNVVFQVIHQCSDEAGVARDSIYARLKGKLVNSQIDKVLEFLSSEGHIYTTIDEDHFKATDGY